MHLVASNEHFGRFIFITQSTLAVFTVRWFQKIQWGSNQVSVGSTYFSHGRNRVIKKWLVPKQFSSAPIRVQFCPRTYYKICLWWPLCAELCNCTIIAMWAKQTSENLLFCPAEPVCVTFPIEAYFSELNLIMPDSGSAVCLTVLPVGKHPLVALIFVVLC